MNRQKLSIGLRQQGHAVEAVEGGSQALAKLRDEAFDVVLLDIVMPDMDGYAVLQRMKSDPTLRDVPVIVISAVDEIESVVRCLEMGAEDYLPKSFDPVVLRARLRASLQKKKLRDLEKIYLQQEATLRQSEKLATLGKLSAGMAHELNNPATAAQRGAARIGDQFAGLLRSGLALSKRGLGDASIQALGSAIEALPERVRQDARLDPLERSDREAELEGWLDRQGVDEPWEAASTLVSVGHDVASLESWIAHFEPDQITAAFGWLVGSAAILSLVREIDEGAGRISEIVRALKSYAYLDQAPVQMVDLHEGLDNTLVILRSKLRHGIAVRREYAADLPAIEAHGSELNQVWTNIIDNAIDAMDGEGEITLRTRRDGQCVVVEIEDSGPGIPPDLQTRIFDPFVTTKPPGQGTGLGLNITHNIVVHRHAGRISVNSQPGTTKFEITLPLRLVRNE